MLFASEESESKVPHSVSEAEFCSKSTPALIGTSLTRCCRTQRGFGSRWPGLFPTLVPIWFPHCPAWMWTISLMLVPCVGLWYRLRSARVSLSACVCHTGARSRLRLLLVRVHATTPWGGGGGHPWVQSAPLSRTTVPHWWNVTEYIYSSATFFFHSVLLYTFIYQIIKCEYQLITWITEGVVLSELLKVLM